MEKRALGHTGIQLSILGFGGVLVTNTEQPEANRLVDQALDFGINYFDISPNYGNAQDRLGPALAGKRNGVFLACKTDKRTRKESLEELENSLRVLGTDCFDLYQFHGIRDRKAVETLLGPDGALETFVKAQKDGKIRYIGFSAHDEEAALMLLDSFAFTSVLFPVNWASLITGQFGNKLMKRAMEKGTARLAIKALARTAWPEDMKQEDKKYQKCWYEPLDDEAHIDLALRYTLSQPITAAIPPGEASLFRMAVKTASQNKPLTPQELNWLEERARSTDPLFPEKDLRPHWKK